MSDEAKAPEEKKELSKNLMTIIESLEKLTVLELADLVKELEDRFGVSAAAMAAPVMMAGAPADGDGGAGAAEEKSEFNVVLTGAGDKKIAVIKVVREATGLGLKEAKELVDNAPKPIKENVPKEQAEELKGKIEEAGGSVELQ